MSKIHFSLAAKKENPTPFKVDKVEPKLAVVQTTPISKREVEASIALKLFTNEKAISASNSL